MEETRSIPGDDSEAEALAEAAPSPSRVDFFVIQDYKENRRKCTVQPLAGTEGLEILRLGLPVPGEELVEMPPGILLEVGAPELGPGDAEFLDSGRLILLDATWIRLAPLARRLCFETSPALQRRSLPGGFRTAYPRQSKLFEDPSAGLASIEAMFAATVILGAPRRDLLREYRWADDFLELNCELFTRHGWEGD